MNRDEIDREGLLTINTASILRPGDLVFYNGYSDKVDKEAGLMPNHWYQLVRARYFEGDLSNTFIFEGVNLDRGEPHIVVDLGSNVKDYHFSWFSKYKITDYYPVEIHS